MVLPLALCIKLTTPICFIVYCFMFVLKERTYRPNLFLFYSVRIHVYSVYLTVNMILKGKSGTGLTLFHKKE